MHICIRLYSIFTKTLIASLYNFSKLFLSSKKNFYMFFTSLKSKTILSYRLIFIAMQSSFILWAIAAFTLFIISFLLGVFLGSDSSFILYMQQAFYIVYVISDTIIVENLFALSELIFKHVFFDYYTFQLFS